MPAAATGKTDKNEQFADLMAQFLPKECSGISDTLPLELGFLVKEVVLIAIEKSKNVICLPEGVARGLVALREPVRTDLGLYHTHLVFALVSTLACNVVLTFLHTATDTNLKGATLDKETLIRDAALTNAQLKEATENESRLRTELAVSRQTHESLTEKYMRLEDKWEPRIGACVSSSSSLSLLSWY